MKWMPLDELNVLYDIAMKEQKQADEDEEARKNKEAADIEEELEEELS